MTLPDQSEFVWRKLFRYNVETNDSLKPNTKPNEHDYSIGQLYRCSLCKKYLTSKAWNDYSNSHQMSMNREYLAGTWCKNKDCLIYNTLTLPPRLI